MTDANSNITSISASINASISTSISTSISVSASTEPFTTVMQNQTNESASNCCLIQPQLLFIVAACVGSLILILLISVVVLSVKLVAVKKKHRARRSTRGDVNMVSGSGHWSNEAMEGGIVGPCEANVLLEEVRYETEDDGANEEEKAMLHQSTTTNMDGENVPSTMQIFTSKDSCSDPDKELEDMPLVV